jgi:HAD superfamily hydrolase (TIGR01509 family)
MDELEIATRLAFDQDLQPVNGIELVLAGTRHPVCVASSGSHAKIRHSLRLTSLNAHFSANQIFSAEDVARGKPAPDLFLHAATEMGVQPQACVVIEDSRPGVDAAVAAGMTVLGFCERTPPHTLRAGGATVFRRMAELPGLLATL